MWRLASRTLVPYEWRRSSTNAFVLVVGNAAVKEVQNVVA